jgi:site-specific recombinase XerD
MLTVKENPASMKGVVGTASDDPMAAVTVAVARFLDACRSANTRDAYRADLGHISRWCQGRDGVDLLTIDVAEVARYRAALERTGVRPATIARRLSALTSFGAFAAADGAAPALAGDVDLGRPATESSSTAEILDDAEAKALLAAADRMSPRAAALIRLLMLDGLKVGDVVDADASEVRGRPPRVTLRLHDRRVRTIELHAETGQALRTYLGSRRAGPLVLSERRGREQDRLTRFGLDYLVKHVARAAEIDRPVSGNTLRRRFVMAAHASGIDLDTIRDNAGHSDRRTTRRYLEP